MLSSTKLAAALLTIIATSAGCRPVATEQAGTSAVEEVPRPELPASKPQPVATADTAVPTPQVVTTAPAVDSDGDKAVNDAIDENLGDHTRYEAVIHQFQSAVAQGDKQAVASLVQYPFDTQIDGKSRRLKAPSEFVASYDDIVTPAIANAITSQKYADLFVNYKGVSFGNGEAWINGICKDGACKEFDVKVVTIQSTQ